MKNPPMIEVKEAAVPGGMRASIVSPELPQGMYCVIYPDSRVGGYIRKNRANGNGSIRYEPYRDYNEAIADGVKWAKRKIAEARRAAKRGW